MCRNIKVLAHVEPPATEAEIHDAALQFVRKIAGTTKPSRTNQAAFDKAVTEIATSASRLRASVESRGQPRNREEVARKARERAARAGRYDRT
ncbi:MAG: DUF2277 domain-containing protein [Gemmatimonadaceae bacterium]|nr:DUF2277 domain-containing protein [Gemmatimonadaceae bacterium]